MMNRDIATTHLTLFVENWNGSQEGEVQAAKAKWKLLTGRDWGSGQ